MAGAALLEASKEFDPETEEKIFKINFTLGLGVIVLDENRQVIEFKSIAPANASEHGLTETEVDVYNSELDIINVVSDEFTKWYNENENENENDKVISPRYQTNGESNKTPYSISVS